MYLNLSLNNSKQLIVAAPCKIVNAWNYLADELVSCNKLENVKEKLEKIITLSIKEVKNVIE